MPRSAGERVGPSQASRVVVFGVFSPPGAASANGCIAASSPRAEISATAPVASSSAEPITPTSDQPCSLAIATTTGRGTLPATSATMS